MKPIRLQWTLGFAEDELNIFPIWGIWEHLGICSNLFGFSFCFNDLLRHQGSGLCSKGPVWRWWAKPLWWPDHRKTGQPRKTWKRGADVTRFPARGLGESTRISIYGCLFLDSVRTSCFSLFPVSVIFPESVWAKGSSNNGGLSTIFTSSRLHVFTSHLLIFTSAHLHICSSSHLLIFSPSHLHIFSSSHLLIFTASHLHIFTSSHPHIFTSSYLHIFSSSHLLIFTSSHPHILTSSHLLIFTSSHLHIFSSSHLHIFTSSHTLLPSCSLAFLLSCPLALSFFSISLLKARGSANETARNATLSHETRFDRQKLK